MIRVWLALLRQAVMRDLQFRSQAWLNLGAGLAELAVGLVPVLVLESYASESSGLSTGSGLLIVAFYGMAAGVVDCFVAPGLRRFDLTLRRGELDLALLRPGSTFVIGILRWMQPPELGKLVAGLALLGYLIVSGVVPVSVPGVLAAVVWLVVGVVVFSCFWTNLVLLAFWTRSIEPINDVAAGVRTAGQYPLGYFPVWARAVLVTVAPAGLLAAVPGEQLVAPTWLVLAAVPAAAVTVVLTGWHWRSGLRSYESASS